MIVEYRRTIGQVVPTAVAVAVVVPFLLARGVPAPLDLLTGIAGGVGAAFGMRTQTVRVEPQGIRIGRRAIPWSRVERVERQRAKGGAGIALLVDGKRVNLPVPVHLAVLQPDPEFDEKAATIESYWRAATSGGSAP